MFRALLAASLAITLSAPLQAAVLVTSDGDGALTRQYFDSGDFVLMQGDRPTFGADRDGNCWFVDRDTLVFDRCEQMLDAMSGMRDQMMAGMGERERAMLAQMMGGQQQAPTPRPLPGRTIAGYDAECHALGDAREVCVSSGLLAEVMKEMGDSRFAEMMQRFGKSASGMPGAEASAALTTLYQRGYPVYDMQQASAMPGINPGMMQFIPEAQRAQIMAQMGAAGGGRPQGTRVVAVERDVAMPRLELSRYQRMNFAQFMQRSMGQVPGMRP